MQNSHRVLSAKQFWQHHCIVGKHLVGKNLEVSWLNLLAQAGTLKISYPGLCPDSFCLSPRIETLLLSVGEFSDVEDRDCIELWIQCFKGAFSLFCYMIGLNFSSSKLLVNACRFISDTVPLLCSADWISICLKVLLTAVSGQETGVVLFKIKANSKLFRIQCTSNGKAL